VTDVTEFKVPGGGKKLYLSAILDLYDRTPVAFVMSHCNDNRLVFKTFDQAMAANPDAKPIFHSDRGFQYTNAMFQSKLKEHGIQQSMSRVGHCIDNGPIEGFWGIIKTEMYQMYEINDGESLQFAIEDYLRFYTEDRPQGRFHCQTPLEIRTAALSTDQPVAYPIPVNKRILKYKAKWQALKTATQKSCDCQQSILDILPVYLTGGISHSNYASDLSCLSHDVDILNYLGYNPFCLYTKSLQ
jgi:putative transposase